MHKKLLVGLITVLALSMGGCQGEDSVEVGDVPAEPTPGASPSPSPSPPEAVPFTNPNVDAQQIPPAASELITTLPPQEQVRKVEKGRPDPFATLKLPPEVTVSPNPQAEARSRPVPVVPQVPSPPQVRRGTNGGDGRPGGGNQSRGTGTSPNRPNVIPKPPTPPGRASANGDGGASANGDNGRKPGSQTASGSPIPEPPPFIPELPKLPDPILARQVEVKGVVQVGNVPQAIVQVPNEPSRYVKEGQRISNGQVLVKRIEVNRGPMPVVVLEQYGQEVARQVGEQPAEAPAQAESSTGSLPPPPA